MKIEFLGGARTVTGSCYIVKDDDFTIMVDCGMFQGKRDLRNRNSQQRVYIPKKIDALLLTHAHIDHSGMIPKLVKNGFYGNIYATNATADLCSIMLPDSAHIQEMDVRWVNKKNRKLGRDPVEPIYRMEDAEKALENFVPVSYEDIVQIHPRVKVRFRDAGHILGSAFIEMWVEDKGKQTKIVFSGDLGPHGQAIIRDPEVIEDADVLLIESTYGDRLHKTREDTYTEFKEIIANCYNTDGNIIIPAFAIERTQEIIYTLSKIFDEDPKMKIPVYIDSPLAISATEIFRRNKQCFDKETQEILLSGNSPLDFDSLKFTRTAKESKRLNKEARGSIIISASGMCTAGRIKFHLQNNLYKKNSSVIFVGFQAEGTLGRRIVEGAKQVRVYGEDVAVNAEIHTLGGFSAHADRDGLLDWMSTIDNPKLKVFIVHGEEKSSMALSDEVNKKFNLYTHVPRWGEIVDLDTMESMIASYANPEKSTLVDLEIDTLTQEVKALVNRFNEVREMKKQYEIKGITNDINDIKEMIKMIKDEL